MLEAHQDIPGFKDLKALDQNGNDISLVQFLGQKLILFFYPKDNTPGCTIESCGFREVSDDFKAINIQIIGISRDSVQKHKNFTKKHNLPFPLIADTESIFCDAFGVIKEKNMFGKKYLGIERSTFLLDERGEIQYVWSKVKIMGHVTEALKISSSIFV